MADKEVLERVRRIETRVTRIGNAMGVDVGGAKPSWDGRLRRVMLPSPNCSIGECRDIIPDDMKHEDVELYIGEQYVCTVFANRH